MGDNSRSTAITVAVIGVIGTLGAALIANWDSVFPSRSAASGAPSSTVGTSGQTRAERDRCVVALATPRDDAVMPQRRLDDRKVETVWMFGWRDCPEASRYHLYVIGPRALNPIVDKDTLTAATYQHRRTSYGVKQLEGWTWKVRAFVDGKWGDWSEERTFSVGPPE